MRFERTDSFKADYKRLTPEEQDKFKEAMPAFSEACDAFVLGERAWPKRFRVKPLHGAKGVFEMTWSFAGPDGRATWEWTSVEIGKGKKVKRVPAVRWRRIGGHEVFKRP